MNTIRILIADDHPFFRLGLHARLALEPDMEIIGEAETATEAINLATTLEPDIVLMDIDFKAEINGIEAARQIRQRHSKIEVLMITYMENDSIFAAIKAGARGYLVKGTTPDAMVDAIRAVSRGEAIYSATIAQRVINYFQGLQPLDSTLTFPELTKRDHEILLLIARGYTNQAIAEQLCIEETSVRNRISKIYNKLHVANRTEAVIRARERGIS